MSSSKIMIPVIANRNHKIFSFLFVIPLFGALIFGILLTAGRYLSFYRIAENKKFHTLIGILMLYLGYSILGGIVLTKYPTQQALFGLIITSIITLIITLVAAVYVYYTDKNLSIWRFRSRNFFLAALSLLFLQLIMMLIPGLGFVADLMSELIIFAIILGFSCDLVFELWMTSERNRGPYKNGIAIYVSVAGIFVHVLRYVRMIFRRT